MVPYEKNLKRRAISFKHELHTLSCCLAASFSFGLLTTCVLRSKNHNLSKATPSWKSLAGCSISYSFFLRIVACCASFRWCIKYTKRYKIGVYINVKSSVITVHEYEVANEALWNGLQQLKSLFRINCCCLSLLVKFNFFISDAVMPVWTSVSNNVYLELLTKPT